MFKPSIIWLAMRDGWNCHYCNKITVPPPEDGKLKHNSATRDHVVPKSFQGTWHDVNLVLACHECNNVRGNMEIYCYCDFCEAAHASAYKFKFNSIMMFNTTKVWKSKRGNWVVRYHLVNEVFPTWQDAIDYVIEKTQKEIVRDV